MKHYKILNRCKYCFRLPIRNISIAIVCAVNRHAALRRAKSDAQLLSISTIGEKCEEKLHNYGRF